MFSIQGESVNKGIQEWAKDKWNILKLLREKKQEQRLSAFIYFDKQEYRPSKKFIL